MDFQLFLRVAVIYPLIGLAAGWFGFVDFDKVSGLMTIDVNAASAALGALIYAGGTAATFAWSRWRARRGGAV